MRSRGPSSPDTLMERVLVIGYGNPARLDDGIGPAVADVLAEMQLPGVTVDADYQLNLEDAARIAEHDAVVFVDATVAGPEPFSFQRLAPRAHIGFTSHAVEPEALLAISRDLFAAERPGYLLGIRGYDFDDFDERLTGRAQANMATAVQFLVAVLGRGELTRATWAVAAAEETEDAREHDG